MVSERNRTPEKSAVQPRAVCSETRTPELASAPPQKRSIHGSGAAGVARRSKKSARRPKILANSGKVIGLVLGGGLLPDDRAAERHDRRLDAIDLPGGGAFVWGD